MRLKDIVITEVFYEDASSDKHWIEIYNREVADTVNLSGYKITWKAGSYTFPSGSTIPSNQYRLLGFQTDQQTNGGVTVDFVMVSTTGGLSTSDDIVLKDTRNRLVDNVSYTRDDNGWPDTGGNSDKSLALKLTGTSMVAAQNWCASPTVWNGNNDQGTPRMANDCP
jgi:Lamin Tail Domain